MGLQETNLNWHTLDAKESWNERTIGWWEGGHRSIMACNEHEESLAKIQPGGCLLTIVNKAKHLIIDQGKDTRGLGRWVWTRYRGKHEISFESKN